MLDFFSLNLSSSLHTGEKRKAFQNISFVCVLCVGSVCIPLPKVPDLTGGGRLDLPHSAGTAHGSGQLGHGLRHCLLPRR